MFVPLPNLDDRRWTDLVDEARALVPVYAPGWTNHNESDPGITLIELLAWITDGDVYRANRVTDANLQAFLALIGVSPRPPATASAAVQFALKTPGAPLPLAATVELDATMLDGMPGKFRLRHPITVLPVSLTAVQVQSAGTFRDATTDWTHRKSIALLGSNPEPGDALYLGFAGPLNRGDVLNVHVELQGETASESERRRILDERQAHIDACAPWNGCIPPASARACSLPPHHSAVLVWEAQVQRGVWRRLAASDDTRSMTLSSTVRLTIDVPPAALQTGASPAPLRYIRCRLDAGSLDSAPVARRILENASEADQCSAAWERWSIAPGVVATGTPPMPGHTAWLRVEFDTKDRVAALDFSAAGPSAIAVVMLAYTPATATQAGTLTVEAIHIGTGTGAPHQLRALTGPELVRDSLRVYSLESGQVRSWSPVGSVAASNAADTVCVVDAQNAEIMFGDGQNGRVPPAGVPLLATTLVTNGAAGNVAAGSISAIDDGPHNVALIDVPTASARLLLTNGDAAAGGAEQETVAHAEGRAALLLDRPERAVTLADCEALARATPGTAVARAAAIANASAALPCYSAPAVITVVIVPHLPVGRPVPSAGLLKAVSAYLNRRRVIGTRIDVTGPDYLEVSVNASVKALNGQNKTTVHDAIVSALRAFLDPLGGGPYGTGWPLGRDVYVSEILETIAKVPGVDHVASLALSAAGCGPQCGDVCLNPLALAVSGSHLIQVS